MRIRRCASRLLGSAVSPASDPALPRFELTPPPPPPAQSQASFVAASGTLEHCELNLSPWDLMDELHLSDPKEEKIFFETYLVAVAWRASWLFQPSMPAARSIKEEEHMAASVIFELQVCKNNAARRKVRNKKEMKPNLNKEHIKEEESDATTGAGGETPVWTCKRWSCWRPASQPNSCSYHAVQKPKRKTAADVGEGFYYYYTGFAPSRTTKRQRRSMLEQLPEDPHTHVTPMTSSSDGVQEPPPAGGQKEEAPADPEDEHIGFTKPRAQAVGAEHQPVQLDEPIISEDGVARIAGYDEESSDDYVVKSRKIQLKSPFPSKKRWRKPVKARSLKSLMY